jgi:hypothetical protein
MWNDRDTMTRTLYTLSFAVILGSLFLPLGICKVIIASIIVLFYPGFLIAQHLFQDHSKAFSVSPVVGMSFWVVVFYIFSGFRLVRIEPVVAISLASAVLLDIRGKYPRFQRWMIPLFVCIAFSSVYFYQWNPTLIPPLDDAKFHAYFVVTIENLHQLPHDYGMYAEIPHLTYPLGYHALVSVVKQLSGQHLFPAMTLSTWFFLLFTPICFYVFSLQYGEKTAVFTAFSFSFLSIFYHRLEQTATYPNLLALEIFVLSLYALRRSLEDFSVKKAAITSLLVASAVEIHVYTLFLYAIFFTLHGLYILFKRNTVSFKHIILIILIMGGYLIPYAARMRLCTPHEEELPYFQDWYARDSLATGEKLLATLSSMSPLLFILSAVSIPSLKNRKNVMVILLSGSILVIPLLSAVGIEYPGWYSVSPNRFLNFAFIPLCVFSGISIARLVSAFGKNILFVLVIISIIFHFTDVFYPWSRVPDISEINPASDMDAVFFMKALPADSMILNFSFLHDPSGWIPSVAERKIFFPPFLLHRGDGCIHYLKSLERLSDFSCYTECYNSPYAIEFLKKYSIDYVFVTSHCAESQVVNLEAFLDSSCYILIYQDGDSYLFGTDVQSCTECIPDNLIIVGGPNMNPLTDEFNSVFEIAYRYTPASFEISCERKSINLDLSQYPREDICIVYLGEDDSRDVMIIWGYGWQGTEAGSLFMGDPQTWQLYEDAHLLLLRWIDANEDGLVQIDEVAVESEIREYESTDAFAELASHEDAVKLANEFLKSRFGAEFLENHFRVIQVDEKPDLPFTWLVRYEYVCDGYAVDISMAIDTGRIPQYNSRILLDSSTVILEPQNILISEEEARTIAQAYGLELPYTVTLSCELEFHRICWKIETDSEKGSAGILIDAERGIVLEVWET